MLTQAAERLADRDITWAQIEDGRLPADDGSCDFVFCYDVFQHIPDAAIVEGYVHETARILRPGGRALLHLDTQRRSPVRQMAYMLPEGMLPRAQRRFIRRYPLAADEPRAMAERAGLQVLEELQAGTRFHQLLITRPA
jgi:ubiquinone/menaquinone biosynthesis C-methylase UbiE